MAPARHVTLLAALLALCLGPATTLAKGTPRRRPQGCRFITAPHVSDNTQGPHAAWPAFLITDEPVPAPYEQAAGLADHARNSVGFTLASVCGQFGCGANDPHGVRASAASASTRCS